MMANVPEIWGPGDGDRELGGFDSASGAVLRLKWAAGVEWSEDGYSSSAQDEDGWSWET